MNATYPPKTHKGARYPVIPARVLWNLGDKIEMRGPNECWPWKLSTGSHGYGQVGWHEDGHTIMTTAHRAAWILMNGPIPEGKTIDHICRNRICCNNRHLRLLTNLENATDNGWAVGIRRRKTHCIHGHLYDLFTTFINSKGNRECRACISIRRKRYD